MPNSLKLHNWQNNKFQKEKEKNRGIYAKAILPMPFTTGSSQNVEHHKLEAGLSHIMLI